MYTQITPKLRTLTAAFAAITIVGLSGLTLDQGHRGALPRGTVEIGELTTLSVGDRVIARLPAVEVIGRRDVMLADVDSRHAGHEG